LPAAGHEYQDELTFSERYGLPSHIVQNLGETPWETIITLGRGFSDKNEGKSPQIRKLQKEISLKRMLLAEMALEQSKEGKLEPGLLVSMVKLLERCEKMAQEYDMDLRDFNSFLALLIEKAKREKLHRHEGEAKRSITHFAPIDEEEMKKLKGRSESSRSPYSGGKKR
jgi:hypothetical protein